MVVSPAPLAALFKVQGRGGMTGDGSSLVTLAKSFQILHELIVPPRIFGQQIERCLLVFDRDFKRLFEDLRNHRPAAIDAYAGTSRAEFFAVSSELFFDAPEFLRRQLPDVCACLAAFYQIDLLSYNVSGKHR